MAAAASAAAGAGRRFTLALSGGSTPRDLYDLLSGPGWSDRLPWARTEVFWGDERCVPPDHPDSNYRLARDHLLSRVAAASVHRMPAELADRDGAAADYEATIRRAVPADPDGVPRFDLMLLGLGGDGHTASLLPGSALIHEQARLVAITDRQREGTTRLTVTPPVLQHAAELLFLLAGSDKAAALSAVLEGPLEVERYPAQVVRSALGRVTFLVDHDAAAALPHGR
jgi:6-phosphogluconolactonase